MLFEMSLMKFGASSLTEPAVFLGHFCFTVFMLFDVFVYFSVFLDESSREREIDSSSNVASLSGLSKIVGEERQQEQDPHM